MEGRLFEDLVVSRRSGTRVGAGGMPLSFVFHAAGVAGLLVLSLAVPEDLPAPPGPTIADVVFARRALAPIADAREEPPQTEPEVFAAHDESDAVCIGCALRDEASGGGGGSDRSGSDGGGGTGTGTGSTPVRVGGHIQAPRKIRHVDPVYPDLARRAGVSGVVILECVIDRDGLIRSVQVLRGHPLLNAAAVNTVRQWAYSPTLLNGVPVAVVMTVTVRFTTR